MRFDPYKFPYRGWAWWILHDLRQHSKDQHQIALLGSSLMVSAVSGCDAIYLNHDLDMTSYHKAQYLDHLLGAKHGTTFDTFDLSIPGQIPSDAYMMLRAMTAIAAPPKVVIYGIAPRDFIDSTLSSPLDTEAFHYLSRIVDLNDIAAGLYQEPLTKFNRFLEQHIYFYGHSLDFQISATIALNNAINMFVPKPWTAHNFTHWDRTKLLPHYHAGELYPTAMQASPHAEKFCRHDFIDNTRDYTDRYKNPRPQVFNTQLFFLGQLANLCHKDGIELILVNMPITDKNVSILTPTRYIDYLNKLRAFGRANDVSIFDLADFKKYTREDFHDLVHLNGYGGRKFFDSLGDAIGKDKRVAELLDSSAATISE